MQDLGCGCGIYNTGCRCRLRDGGFRMQMHLGCRIQGTNTGLRGKKPQDLGSRSRISVADPGCQMEDAGHGREDAEVGFRDTG